MTALDIWLIDDEKEIYLAVSLGLRQFPQIQSLRWFQDCGSALDELAAGPPPQVFLLDVNLPDMSGVDAIPHIKAAAPDAKIIMLTMDDRSVSVVKAASRGINGYLLKPFKMEDVIRACEQALEGGVPMDPTVVPHLIDRLPPSSKSLKDYGITRTEEQVLTYIVQGLTDVEIAAKLRSSYHTIRTHLKHLHRKLRVQSRSELTAKALRERLL